MTGNACRTIRLFLFERNTKFDAFYGQEEGRARLSQNPKSAPFRDENAAFPL